MVYQVLKKKFERYEAWIFGIALVGGIVVDSLTLVRIDRSRDHIILSIYLLIASVGIVYVTLFEGRRLKGPLYEKLYPWFLFLMQFSFGGLFSNFIVLYSRSASFRSSWPFILLLSTLLLGNEIFKRHYTRLTLRLCIFFLALFSFSIFFVPILLGKMGDFVFLLSGAISLGLISLFCFLLLKIIPSRIHQEKKQLLPSIAIIFLFINALYFLNVIPPIPLSLKDAGVYHSAARNSNGEYEVSVEPEAEVSFWGKIFPPDPVIHLQKGESAYVLSSIFAPSRLATDVVHRWSYYDENSSVWTPSFFVTIPITGGRDDGFRAYSYRKNMLPGKWRVDIETLGGQVIGRVSFTVERAESTPLLETTSR